MQVSAPVRIVAILGLLGALAMGAWLMTAGRAASDSEQPVEQLRPVRKAEAVASKLSAHGLATAAASPARAAAPKAVAIKPVATKHVVRHTNVKAAPKLPKGTPRAIGGLLAEHRVGVVLLYDSKSKVDAYSLSETVLGAKNAGAGFRGVDVRNERFATAFSKAYGVLQAPSILFFSRPGTVALRLNGFADHETVEQAVLNVAHGLERSAH